MKSVLVILAGIAAGLPAAASATVSIYKTSEDFSAALTATGAIPEVLDFESIPSGTVISPLPQSFGGLTFDDFVAPGYDLYVASGAGGTSGNNYLRVTDDGGDSSTTLGFDDHIYLSFDQPTNALGFYIIVGSADFNFFADDINITIGGNTYSNDGSETATLVNGVDALFFGVVDTGGWHESAEIFFGDIGTSLGDIDDISYSTIPEPSQVALVSGLAMLLMIFIRRKRAGLPRG